MKELLLGLITGAAFGFLLQKGRVLRFEKQVNAMRLVDMTIVKFMFSAVLVGMIGIHALEAFGVVAFKLKATQLGANIIGGLLFGVGWALLGYCPGTSLGALGEGRWHAAWGILGMILGAALYAEIYPLMARSVLTWGDFGKITLPGILHVNPWVVIVVFLAAGGGLFRFFEKKGL